MIRKIIIYTFLLGLANLSIAQTIVTDSTSNSYSKSDTNSNTTVHSPPPSAISPAVTVINSDVCVTAYSGAAQTQILGISFGSTNRDLNCERLKLARSLYDMGMKVAAVATMCQDRRVFDSMMAAGTPCPIDGKIGADAKVAWEAEPNRIPKPVKE